MSGLFLDEAALARLGLRAFGHEVRISPHALFFQPQYITLGSHVRIDAFCVLSAGAEGIAIGDHVHLSVGVSLFGTGGAVRIGHFASVSARSLIYTASDDFRDGWLIGPTVPDELRRVETGDVILEPHALVGCGSVLLPGVTLEKGCVVGALSLVKRSVPSGALVAGVPARIIGRRDGERLAPLEAEARRRSRC